MFGKNKILRPENHAGLALDVTEIFSTLQGEGPYAGHPSVFIRLGGCNLSCNFCDTEFDNFQNRALSAILLEVKKQSKNKEEKRVRNLVVITGGEPLRQPIEMLCEELIKSGFLVQIETNGTIFRNLPKEVKIVCSPKTSNKKYFPIRPDLAKRISAFKFIISANDQSYMQISELAKLNPEIPIYLQPMDEYNQAKNQANLQLTSELCQKYGYLLSLQIHKILKIK